ncbi:LysR family transcriptional regulator [Algihabitans albus]|uniref:LysR family transcriptional regulator n=1 Tax=Algihabitans albus TaxID=2164067 RepID=UPI0035D1094A
MDRTIVHGIDVFLTIVREGSMRAAAAKLGVGAPTISLQLKSLEERLGIELLARTTRRLELTDAGQALFDGAAPAYRDLAGAVEKARQTAAASTRTLRLSMSRGAYLVAVAPVLKGFLSSNPGIILEISWNEELVDIERKGFHAGLRLGDVLAADMAAVRASAPVPSTFFASPAYLETNGRPRKPHDLLDHHCIRHRHPTSGQLRDWWVMERGQRKRIAPSARLVFDSAMGVIQAARDGLGVGWSMQATMEDHIRTGELEVVLDGFAADLPPFYLYFPERNAAEDPLRLFIDSMKQHSA